MRRSIGEKIAARTTAIKREDETRLNRKWRLELETFVPAGSHDAAKASVCRRTCLIAVHPCVTHFTR